MENDAEKAAEVLTQDTAQATEKTKKKRPWLTLLAAVLVLAAAVGFASYKNYIIWFRHGLYLCNKESIALQVEADEVYKLDHFTQLKTADLRGSKCYKEIYGWSQAHPDVEVLYDVPLPSGAVFDPVTGIAELESLSYEDAETTATEDLAYMKGVSAVRLGLDYWTPQQILAFAKDHPEYKVLGGLIVSGMDMDTFRAVSKACPEVVYRGNLRLGENEIMLHSQTASLPGASAEDIAMLESCMDILPDLKSIDFGAQTDGYSRLAAVDSFAKKNPQTEVSYKFKAFGKTIGYHDTKLDLNHITMNDQGKAVRSIIEHMPDLTYLDMDFCGVDNTHMAAIRDDFPNVKVVWRIWFGKVYSVRTDVKKILASAPLTNGGSLTPETAASLKYCTELKYLDLGHNDYLSDISFCAYMPKLEVLIIMGDNIHDISALAKCPNLEFLEVFNNYITTLEPLRNCKNLKHLNICSNQRVHDLSPLYGHTQLERLWTGIYSGIPMSQINEFKKRVPTCVVSTTAANPHDNWRGNHPRYLLLRKQLGYDTQDYQYYWRDPLYYPHD